jgi:tetratricopeptide (TPR) repeat protein
MKISFLLVLLTFLSAGSVASQPLSKGKERVQQAMAFQAQLKKGTTSLGEVREEWKRAVNDPSVKKDKDALAIALSSQAIVERDMGDLPTADSLFESAMPLFQLKASKAYFLVTLANVKKELKRFSDAMESFTEIANDFDSLPQLRQIAFYANSGYADYAYAIDAARNITLLGLNNPSLKSKAIRVLDGVVKKHPADELGLMALVGLAKLDTENLKHRDFQKEFLFSKKQEMRDLADKFAKQFE